MVARPGEFRSNVNAGEIGPNMHGRIDVKQFYSAGALMKNLEPVAQGGFRLSPRTRKCGRQRGLLTAIASGGAASGEFDSVATVQTVAFDGLRDLSVVRLERFLTAGEHNREAALQIEYQDGADSWHAFGLAFRVTRRLRTRAVGLAPGAKVQAKAIRLRWLYVGDLTPFASAALVALAESPAYGPVRHRPFTFSNSQTYVAVFTPHHVDFWRDGTFVGCGWHNLDEAMVMQIDTAQRFDLMLVFEDDAASLRIMRDGADHEWPSDPIPFEDVPQVDYGGSYAKTTDVWEVYFRYPSGEFDGRVLSFKVNGETTTSVTVAGVDKIAGDLPDPADLPAFFATIAAAIGALPSVRSNPTVTQVGSATAYSFTFSVAFGGDDDGNAFVFSSEVVSHTDSSTTVAHIAVGDRGGEDLFGDTRGYAAAGIFFQDRLLQGGFRAKKSALLAGVSGDYFNTNIKIESGTGALLYNLDTDGAEQIQRFARSKHLLVFTSDAEYFVSDRAISRGTVPNVVECSRNGSASTVPIVSNEGALYYVSRDRSIVYEAKYSDLLQSYESLPISLLASHIVSEVNDAALQRAAADNDAARHYLVRDDGTMTIGVMIRNQDICGFARWETEGAVKAICVDGKNVPYATIERVVDGVPLRFFEQLTRATFLDCASDYSFETPQTVVGQLEDYEGATVWAYADGFVQGPFTVSGAQITLQYPASAIQIGRWTEPDYLSLPMSRAVADRVVLARPIRVHTVRTHLLQTTSIAIGANGEPPEDLPLYRAGDPTDAPLAPFSGEPDPVTGLRGFSLEGQVRITQLRPGWLHVRDIIAEAKT